MCLDKNHLMLIFEEKNIKNKIYLHVYELGNLVYQCSKEIVQISVKKSFIKENKIYLVAQTIPYVRIFDKYLTHFASFGSQLYPNEYMISSNVTVVLVNLNHVFLSK